VLNSCNVPPLYVCVYVCNTLYTCVQIYAWHLGECMCVAPVYVYACVVSMRVHGICVRACK